MLCPVFNICTTSGSPCPLNGGVQEDFSRGKPLEGTAFHDAKIKTHYTHVSTIYQLYFGTGQQTIRTARIKTKLNCLVLSAVVFTPPTDKTRRVLSCPCRRCEQAVRSLFLSYTSDYLTHVCHNSWKAVAVLFCLNTQKLY